MTFPHSHDNHTDPYVCPHPGCNESFPALFLYLYHARQKHGQRNQTPLSPAAGQEGSNA
jgi:hypothetical protein